ncbi:MAG TPA: MarR family transcriptional regulator [Candidatus Saccharimonadia bacterium]|nr:MarR family transcriptional regulator [Candidatus Saccharimonadia bacterium]
MEDFEFIFELNRAVNIFNAYYDVRIAPSTGISRAQFTVLLLINRFPGITRSELARKLSCSHVAIGRIVKILVGVSYVEESLDSQNQHVVHLKPTKLGASTVKSVTTIFERESASLFASLKAKVMLNPLREQLMVFSEIVLEQKI